MKELLTKIRENYSMVWDKLVIHKDKLLTQCEYDSFWLTFHDLECFFDENEIYIDVGYLDGNNVFEYNIYDRINDWVTLEKRIFETRTEAKTQAILKASEILENKLRGE